MLTAEDVLQEFNHESDATRRLLAAVPDARLAWRPHLKSRTLGRLALHVLRLQNVPVPIVYGPTADENPFGQ